MCFCGVDVPLSPSCHVLPHYDILLGCRAALVASLVGCALAAWKCAVRFFFFTRAVSTQYFIAPPPFPLALPSQASEVEETLKRIRSHRGVEGILIVNNDGVSLKSTLSAELTTQYASLFAQVSHASRVAACLPSQLRCSLCTIYNCDTNAVGRVCVLTSRATVFSNWIGWGCGAGGSQFKRYVFRATLCASSFSFSARP